MAHNSSRSYERPSHARREVFAAAAAALLFAAGSAAPAAAASGRFSLAGSRGGVGFGYATSSSANDDQFQYALIKDGSMTSMTGTWTDSEHRTDELKREVQRNGAPLLWFAKDGRDYVVRDPKTIDRAGEIMEPMRRLGAEQAKLGASQGELGREQGKLGAIQGRIGAIEGRLAALRATDDAHFRTETAELQQQLAELSQTQREAGERQRALGEQQRELGRRQRELGDEQRRAGALALDQMRDLAEHAISSGTAQPLASD